MAVKGEVLRFGLDCVLEDGWVAGPFPTSLCERCPSAGVSALCSRRPHLRERGAAVAPTSPGGRSPCPPRKLLESGAASSPDGGSALVEARPSARCRRRLLARRRRMAATGGVWSVLVASFRRRGEPVPLLGTVVSPVKPQDCADEREGPVGSDRLPFPGAASSRSFPGWSTGCARWTWRVTVSGRKRGCPQAGGWTPSARGVSKGLRARVRPGGRPGER